MWPLTDTALHLLEDANLISARRNRVDLDLESLWDELGAPALARGVARIGQLCTARTRIRELDDRLFAVAAHAWPRPGDPVVIALRRQAARLRAVLAAAC